MPPENSSKSRRLMHTRSIECEGFLRDDGLWEVEAWLRDTKPFTQRADRFRDELKPGDPMQREIGPARGNHAACVQGTDDPQTHPSE